MNKLVILKTKAMTHNFCHFTSLDGQEIDCVLQTVKWSFLHNNLQNHFVDLLQLIIYTYCQLPSLNDNRGCHGPT